MNRESPFIYFMTDEPDVSDRRINVWHIGKEVPISLIGTIIVQTILAVWWLANLSSKVDTLDAKIVNLTNTTVTVSEARGANELNSHRNIEQDRRIGELEKELRALAQQHQQMVIMFQRNGARR